MIDRLASIICGALLGIAFLLAGLAVLERIANVYRYTVVRGYAPSHLLGYACVALLFVIALQLREIKAQRRS